MLIIDPETSQLLAQQTEPIRPVEWVDADPPVVLYSIEYLERGGSARSARDLRAG